MKFIALLLPFFLMACSNPPVRHDHTIYEYKIKYGSSLNNLDKEFVKTCDLIEHYTFQAKKDVEVLIKE